MYKNLVYSKCPRHYCNGLCVFFTAYCRPFYNVYTAVYYCSLLRNLFLYEVICYKAVFFLPVVRDPSLVLDEVPDGSQLNDEELVTLSWSIIRVHNLWTIKVFCPVQTHRQICKQQCTIIIILNDCMSPIVLQTSIQCTICNLMMTKHSKFGVWLATFHKTVVLGLNDSNGPW